VTDLATAYRGVRVRVRELVVERPAAADTVVPAAPEWTVHDVVAHLGGITADIVAGNIDGAGTDEWAAAQVAAREHREIVDLLDEWDECAGPVEAMVDSLGAAGGQLLGDAVTHEHDLRGALGCPGERGSDALAIGFDWLAKRVGTTWRAAGLGALTVEHEAGATTCGRGTTAATVRVTRFEFTRAATGRRSLDQIEAYEWANGRAGEARPDLLVVTPFTPRLAALVE
jgi:uncharacterized protein (TIGR03083 family)